MKIIVLVKQVPDSTEIRVDKVTGALIREGVPTIINPDDLAGVEEALKIKETMDDVTVTVISMGPPQAGGMLKELYGRGVDECILVTDRKFGGADTCATSITLAAAIEKCGNYDLIIAGRQAIDGDTAQVGPELAEHLDIPQVTYLEDCKFDGNKTLTIKKQLEDGYQMVQVEMPCLVSVLASSYKPRYMSVSGIVECFDKEIETWTVDNIKVEEEKLGKKGSPTNVKKSFAKAVKGQGEVFEVEAEEAVELIISKLKEKHII